MNRLVFAAIAFAIVPLASYSAEPNKLQAAICSIDSANKSMLLLPWDTATRSWQKDSMKTVYWEDATQLISGSARITIAQLAKGTSLDATVKTVDDIVREQGVLELRKVGDKEIARSVERLTILPGQQRAGRVGVGPDGKPQFIPIGDGKVHVCDGLK